MQTSGMVELEIEEFYEVEYTIIAPKCQPSCSPIITLPWRPDRFSYNPHERAMSAYIFYHEIVQPLTL